MNNINKHIISKYLSIKGLNKYIDINKNIIIHKKYINNFKAYLKDRYSYLLIQYIIISKIIHLDFDHKLFPLLYNIQNSRKINKYITINKTILSDKDILKIINKFKFHITKNVFILCIINIKIFQKKETALNNNLFIFLSKKNKVSFVNYGHFDNKVLNAYKKIWILEENKILYDTSTKIYIEEQWEF
jgi:hypothetical protein